MRKKKYQDLIAIGLKPCTKCLATKPLSAFVKRMDQNAYSSWCRDCTYSASKATRGDRLSEGYIARRDIHLKRRFKITYEDYIAELADQDGKCAICKTPQAVHKKAFAVDHDSKCCSSHVTCGKCIRGLLCERCNRALGLFKDDVDILQNAINYLSRP